MLSLIIATFATGIVDCFNPVVITQHFVLQGLVKKKHHIWAFILASGFTNFLSGILVYYGFTHLIDSYYEMLITNHAPLFYTILFVLGLLFVLWAFYHIIQHKIAGQLKTAESNEDDKPKFKSLHPMYLAMIGIVSTICEIPTAVPYFAFLTILLTYELNILTLLGILLLYNLIYISPSIALYIIYVKFQSTFDILYYKLQAIMNKWIKILTPIFLGVVGFLLIYFVFGQIV